MGNEATGLTNETKGACTAMATIPGTGQIESLNVSVAASILLGSPSLAMRAPCFSITSAVAVSSVRP